MDPSLVVTSVPSSFARFGNRKVDRVRSDLSDVRVVSKAEDASFLFFERRIKRAVAATHAQENLTIRGLLLHLRRRRIGDAVHFDDDVALLQTGAVC